jgi:HEAT repeat protein
VPALLAVLTDEDEHVRVEALESLVAIDPEGERVPTAVVAALSDKDETVRETAAYLCSRLGQGQGGGAGPDRNAEGRVGQVRPVRGRGGPEEG